MNAHSGFSDLPRGVAVLRDPTLNKGTAFTEAERDALGLRGLLPPRVSSQQHQEARVLTIFGASAPISRNTSTSRFCTTAMRRSFSASWWTIWKK